MIKVLFVCMGNICRSPTAQGVFESLVRAEGLDHAITADSAATHAYHIGKPPDGRSAAAAARRGIDISGYRARQAAPEDFQDFDLILAMDRDNRDILARLAPEARDGRLRLFLEYAPDLGLHDVPDPYYGGEDGFEHVLDLAEAASRGLLNELKAIYADRLGPPDDQE
jgi:protein-tyrosine phosphatase